MAVLGDPRNFHHKYAFLVEIDDVEVAKFTKAGPLEHEYAVVEVNEGGSLIPHKELGRAKFTDLVLERGVTDDKDLYDWMQQAGDIAANTGLVMPKYKRNIDIIQLNRDGATRCRWRISNAFPIKFQAGDWDNDASEASMEIVTLAYDYYKKVTVAQ